MNWLQKTSKSLLEEIKLRGWTKEQLSADAVDIWRNGNEFLISLGDWAKVEPADLIGAVRHLYPDAEIECDAECGAPEGWEKVL